MLWIKVLATLLLFSAFRLACPQVIPATPLPAALAFGYALPTRLRTSAGIFDANGILVKTLWSGRVQEPGQYMELWDGTNDELQLVSKEALWTVRLLVNDVRYTWDGVIGNTENSWTASTSVWDGLGYNPTRLRLTFTGNKIWASTGYSEGTANLITFSSSTPNSPSIVQRNYRNQNVQLNDIDTDGRFLYVASAAAWAGMNFVAKLDAASGLPVDFPAGSRLKSPTVWDGTAFNAIAVSPRGSSSPESVAVSTIGSVLAVAYPQEGKLSFFSSISGTQLGPDVFLPAPSSMGFTKAGLWVLSGHNVFLVHNFRTHPSLTRLDLGLSNPMFIATNKTNNHLFVLDGGKSQQVKEFDFRQRLVRTYGQLGGYRDMDPTVNDRRLLLDNTATKGNGTSTQSWIRVGPHNDFWLCDGGNAGRILHVNERGNVLHHVQFQQETYTTSVGSTIPDRLFRNGLEYKVRYDVPLMPGDPDPDHGGNGAWSLVRNWSVGAEGANHSAIGDYQVLNGSGGVIGIERLSNGRIYAHVVDNHTKRLDEVELPLRNDQPWRFVRTISINQGDTPLQPDGSLLRLFITWKNPVMETLEQSALLRFDDMGNPIRGPFVPIAHVLIDPTKDPVTGNGWGMYEPLTMTTSGIAPVFAPQPRSKGFPHLAGMRPGIDTYAWKTLPEGSTNLTVGATFPGASGYGGHNGIGTQAIGENVFASYDGQYAVWGNQHFHYWSDGLFVGQFGYSAGWKRDIPMPAGSAGNIAQTRYVQSGQDIFMYMTVEAGYTPIQRWRISNLGTIHELSSSGHLGEHISLK